MHCVKHIPYYTRQDDILKRIFETLWRAILRRIFILFLCIFAVKLEKAACYANATRPPLLGIQVPIGKSIAFHYQIELRQKRIWHKIVIFFLR